MLFLVLAACYAWAALCGVLEISSGGAALDSDLRTYAQGMAGVGHPECFRDDPVLRVVTHHNSIWNVQRFLAVFLTPGDSYAVGLLRAGALALFIFYAGYYFLGRWLFRSPGLASLLALAMGVTFWVGWGTFWGVTHSDPVPRVFFAAIWPFLLLGAVAALNRPWLRLLVMLGVGLSIWVHSISALATGAMLFMAFALKKSENQSLTSHLLHCLACLSLFFIPVLAFLWPTLSQEKIFSSMDMEALKNVFNLRYVEDYSMVWLQLRDYLLRYSLAPPLFLAGLAGWLLARSQGAARVRALAGMYPGFLLGLAGVVIFSWLEGRWAAIAGHLPLGHELVRGARFLVPLSWLAVVAGVACFWPRLCVLWRVTTVVAALSAVLLYTSDRQHIAALHYLHASWLSPYGEEAQEAMHRSAERRTVFETLRKMTRPGEMVFSNDGDLAVRYLALRGLFHAFKDGANAFYDRDADRARTWLRYNALMSREPTGYIDAWLASGVPWLLSSRPQDKALLEPYGDVLWENDGWLIARRRGG